MIQKLLFICLVLLTITRNEAFGQTLKSDGWKITMESWDEQKVNLFGKTQIGYTGILKVEKGKKDYATYRVYLISMNDTLTHLAVYDGASRLEPRLYWNEKNKSFTYNQGTPEEVTAVTEKNGNIKEIMLSGLLIWLKQLK